MQCIGQNVVLQAALYSYAFPDVPGISCDAHSPARKKLKGELVGFCWKHLFGRAAVLGICIIAKLVYIHHGLCCSNHILLGGAGQGLP